MSVHWFELGLQTLEAWRYVTCCWALTWRRTRDWFDRFVSRGSPQTGDADVL